MWIELVGTRIDVYWRDENQEKFFLSFDVRKASDNELALLGQAVRDKNLQAVSDLWDRFN
jgi:hypothetical protein